MDVRELVSQFGACDSQPASDWQGDIPLPAEIARFYDEVGPLGESDRKGYLGVSMPGLGNDIELVPLARLWKEQAGFRWDGRTNEPIADWPSQWIALAWEGGTDTYVFDANTQTMLFSLAGSRIEDAYPINAGPIELVGALALFGQRIQEAGDDAMTEDYDYRPEWIEAVRKELVQEFGAAGEGIIKISTEEWPLQ